jgi:hypothetical protein
VSKSPLSFLSTFFVSAGLLCGIGCEARLADFTAMSSKNLYAKNVDVRALPKTENVEAQKITFLGIGANIKDPLDMCLEKASGNLMIDGVVYEESYIIFGGYKVRGTVVKVP